MKILCLMIETYEKEHRTNNYACLCYYPTATRKTGPDLCRNWKDFCKKLTDLVEKFPNVKFELFGFYTKRSHVLDDHRGHVIILRKSDHEPIGHKKLSYLIKHILNNSVEITHFKYCSKIIFSKKTNLQNLIEKIQ